jgi:hypothetical protein
MLVESSGYSKTMEAKVIQNFGAAAEMAREKSLQVNMRMRPDLKVAADEAARADHRSFASLVEKLLTDYCREHGYLTKEGRLAGKKGRR